MENRYYHLQHNKDVEHQGVKMYCSTNQFPELCFIGPNNKPHGVRVLGNHYHMSFDPKLGHVTCAMRCIPCYCNFCTSIIHQLWIPGIPVQKQSYYRPIKYFTYLLVLGSLTTGTL